MYRTRPRLRYVCTDEHHVLSNETYDVHSRNEYEQLCAIIIKQTAYTR